MYNIVPDSLVPTYSKSPDGDWPLNLVGLQDLQDLAHRENVEELLHHELVVRVVCAEVSLEAVQVGLPVPALLPPVPAQPPGTILKYVSATQCCGVGAARSHPLEWSRKNKPRRLGECNKLVFTLRVNIMK